MKKRSVIAVIVAVALILSGGLLLVLGLSYAGTAAPQETLTMQEILISEPFSSVDVDTADCDVEFVLYNGAADAQVTVTGEPERVSHEVTVEEGILKIQMIDGRKWTDHIGIFGLTEHMKLTLYLPHTQYQSFQVTTDTGNMKIPGVLMADEVVLRSDTGDVWLEGGPVAVLDCMVSTGDITVRGGDAKTMKLRTDTGRLDVSGVVAEELHMAGDTGKTNVADTTTQVFSFNGSTGEVELDGVRARDYLQVFTSTGDITVRNCMTETANIETGTGNITVPAAWEFQRIETDTGKITFE